MSTEETAEVVNIEVLDVFADAVPVDQRKTIPILNKFERTKLIGVRMQQIAKGAVPMVPTEDLASTEAIVLKELEERKLPMVVKRPLPNGMYEIWRLEELTY